MKNVLLALSLVGVCGMASAATQCNAPKDKWMSEADFKAKATAMGFEIMKFKVSSGNCYEIYGKDKTGQKVEIYFDPATMAEVKRK